jgi:hypothetical protein
MHFEQQRQCGLLPKGKQTLPRGGPQVKEVAMENEYALRLKDAATAERLRELADRGAAEREAERARADALLAEKNEAELEYEDQLRQAEQRHQAGSGCSCAPPNLR